MNEKLKFGIELNLKMYKTPLLVLVLVLLLVLVLASTDY